MDEASAQDREFIFTDSDFSAIRALAMKHAGINLGEGKREMVYSRLSRRLRQLGLSRFEEYRRRLEGDNPEELTELINALTTNLTAFFREEHHFRFLQERLLPELLGTKRESRRIRLWSAGCSTGEEAYSMAMVVEEVVPRSGWDVKILATDLDSNVIETARRGVYSVDRVEKLPEARLRRWFLRGGSANAEKVRVKPELQERITFRQLNLLNPWPFHGPFDVIFCRNVVIYFDKPTQRALFDRFADLLTPSGHLFIGHSETLFKVSERFALVGNTIYRRSS